MKTYTKKRSASGRGRPVTTATGTALQIACKSGLCTKSVSTVHNPVVVGVPWYNSSHCAVTFSSVACWVCVGGGQGQHSLVVVSHLPIRVLTLRSAKPKGLGCQP